MGSIKLGVKKVFNDIQRDIAAAQLYAMNRAAGSARVAAIKFIRTKYNIKAKVLRDAIKIFKATKGRRFVRISVMNEPIGLIKFSSRQTARPKRYNKGRVGGTKVTVKKGQRKLREHAFIAVMPSGHKGVFIRSSETTSSGKQRLYELFGPSARDLFAISETQRILEEKYFERVEIEFAIRLKYLKNK